MARIFLALTPEKYLNDQIIDVKKGLKSNILRDANISWQRNDQHHITVYFVGEMEPEQIAQMNVELSKINLLNFSSSIVLTEVSFFPNENSQVLAILIKPNSYLENLYKKVEEVVVNIGLGSDLKAYRPHITLGRFKEKEHPKYEFEIFECPLKGKTKQLSVFESELNKGKTEYNLLSSFDM